MDNLVIEYGTKLWDMGYELKVNIRYNGDQWVFVAEMYDRFTKQHQAGGGFFEPLRMFEYLDKCMENHERMGTLLPVSISNANTAP